MGIIELLLIAVGLSMDAFAVAVCSGLSNKETGIKHALVVGIYFGVFQALMPMIGYFAGIQFADVISAYDHWIAFILLALIGGRMIKGSFDKQRDEACPASDNALHPKRMLPLAVATSIDALAVGVSFAFLYVDIVPALALIGLVTFALSAAGVRLGGHFGTKLKSGAELAGGVILVLIGAKILLEHLNVIAL